MFNVKFHRAAQKELDNLPLKDKERILKVIPSLSINPFQGKKLEGEYVNHYSIRVWPYRIIYIVYKKELVIIIVKVGHRQGVY